MVEVLILFITWFLLDLWILLGSKSVAERKYFLLFSFLSITPLVYALFNTSFTEFSFKLLYKETFVYNLIPVIFHRVVTLSYQKRLVSILTSNVILVLTIFYLTTYKIQNVGKEIALFTVFLMLILFLKENLLTYSNRIKLPLIVSLLFLSTVSAHESAIISIYILFLMNILKDLNILKNTTNLEIISLILVFTNLKQFGLGNIWIILIIISLIPTLNGLKLRRINGTS